MIRAVKAIALARQLAIWTRDITTLRNVVDRIVREAMALLLQGLRESVPASAPSQPSGV
jgi:hypothetical protein